MPRLQQKQACSVEAHNFFPNSLGHLDGARPTKRPPRIFRKPKPGVNAAGGKRVMGDLFSEGRTGEGLWVKSQGRCSGLTAFPCSSVGAGVECCCSPRSSWPTVAGLGGSPRHASAFPARILPPGTQLCPSDSYQAKESNCYPCLVAFHIKSHPLCGGTKGAP